MFLVRHAKSSRDDPSSGVIADMPTCALAEFGYDTKAWSDVGGIAPTKLDRDAPKS